MSETIRAFIAAELPEAAVSYIADIQEKLRSYRFKLRWVDPGNIHLTLKFLGDISQNETGRIGDIISDSAKSYRPMQFSIKGLGVFPGVKKARVIWSALKGDTDVLAQLQNTLEEKIAASGFPRDKRPFKGHLTLARAKIPIPAEKVIHAMQEISGLESEAFQIDTVTLFRSDLRPSGAVYTELKRVVL